MPPDVQYSCEAKFTGFNQTVIIEEANKVFGDAMRTETMNGAISRNQRYRKLQTCPLLKEWGRKPVEIIPDAAFARGADMPEKTFEAENHVFSLGGKVLAKLGDPSWSSTSPEQEDITAFSQFGFRRLGWKWNEFKKSWPSVLFPEGQVVYKTGFIGFVFANTRHGALVWALK